MTGPDVRSDDAVDFLDYAAARQGPALRAATLVTGAVARVARSSGWGSRRAQAPATRRSSRSSSCERSSAATGEASRATAAGATSGRSAVACHRDRRSGSRLRARFTAIQCSSSSTSPTPFSTPQAKSRC